MSTKPSKQVSAKHQKRKKYECDLCKKSFYNINEHKQHCPRVKEGTAKKTHRGTTRATRPKFLEQALHTYIPKDDKGKKFFQENNLYKEIQNFLKILQLPADKSQKLDLRTDPAEDGVIHVRKGDEYKEFTLKDIKTMIEQDNQFYSYQEYEITTEKMERVIKEYKLPTYGSFFNKNSLMMNKIGVFFSNGDSYVHEHKDPGAGFLVMIFGGVTRVIFTESAKHATLAATGDMVFIKNNVAHKVFSKGLRLCFTFFSFSEQDYAEANQAAKQAKKG